LKLRKVERCALKLGAFQIRLAQIGKGEISAFEMPLPQDQCVFDGVELF
jgi:hypothetical protein